MNNKLKLTYIKLPKGIVGCIPESHYDLHTDEKEPKNIACILTDKEGAKLIREFIGLHNCFIDFVHGRICKKKKNISR